MFEIAARLRPTRRPTSSLREAELVDQRRACARGLDRVQVLARHVLDQRELEPLALLGRAHERRDPLEAGELRRAQAALAGDQLVAAARQRPHEHRLEHAARADRLGELAQRPRRRSVVRG